MFPCPPLASGLTAPCILVLCSTILVPDAKLNGLVKSHTVKVTVNLPVNPVLSHLPHLVAVPILQHFINQSHLPLFPFFWFVLYMCLVLCHLHGSWQGKFINVWIWDAILTGNLSFKKRR